MSLDNGDTIVEFANRETGTWTLYVVDAAGQICGVYINGRQWKALKAGEGL